MEASFATVGKREKGEEGKRKKEHDTGRLVV